MPNAKTSEVRSNLWGQRYISPEISAVQEDPNSDANIAAPVAGEVNQLQGHDHSEHATVIYDIVIKTAVGGGYNWEFYRFIEDVVGVGLAAGNPGTWVLEDTGLGAITVNTIGLEFTNSGDRTFLRISALAAGSVIVCERGSNRER